MRKFDLIRAWKDEDYRLGLSDAERALVPENPAGALDLSDEDLEAVVGASTERCLTVCCCSGLTTDPGLCSILGCATERALCGPPTYDFSCK